MKKYCLKAKLAFVVVLLLSFTLPIHYQTPVFAQSQSSSSQPPESSDRDIYEETYPKDEEESSSAITPEPPGSFESEESESIPDSQVDETSESEESISESIEPIESESSSSESSIEETSQTPPIQSESTVGSRPRQSNRPNPTETRPVEQTSNTNSTLMFTLLANRLYNNQMSMGSWMFRLVNSDMIDLLEESFADVLPFNLMSIKYRSALISSVFFITSLYHR